MECGDMNKRVSCFLSLRFLSGLPVMPAAGWLSAYSRVKPSLFLSTLVERFSGLAGDFIFNYFPNTRQMAGYLRTVRLDYSIKFDMQMIGLHWCGRHCLVRNINKIFHSPP